MGRFPPVVPYDEASTLLEGLEATRETRSLEHVLLWS